MANTENQVIEIIPTLLVGDSSFDASSIPNSTLCVELDERHIRFCIVRDEQMECVWLEDYQFEAALGREEIFEKLRKILSGHMLWSAGVWKNVRVSVNSSAFSLIPNVLFKPESVPDYLAFALGKQIGPDDKMLHHDLPLVHATNVFTVPQSWYDQLANHFGTSEITFYHFSSPLIIGALVSHLERQELRIASIYLEKDSLTFVVTESQRLIFCNRFKYNQVQELVYIILFTLGQLNLSPDDVKVLCYGEINTSAEVYSELGRFFGDLEIGTRPTTLKYSVQCAEVPGHRYFGLFNTYLVSS